MSVSGTILAQLGPSPFAVLDGAREPGRLRSFVLDTRSAAWCLFRGELPKELEDAAPWLLRIVPGKPWVEQLFERGWGNQWGILIASEAPSRDLRRHLRRFLRVRDEDGRILAFRYYDPRVLRVYLPTCTPEEIEQFFGPVTAMIAEGEEPGTAHVFRKGAAGLEQQLLKLS